MTTRKAKPSIVERANEPTCVYCGETTVREGGRNIRRSYCGKACKTSAHNLRVSRGHAIVGWAMAWRIDRGQGEIAKGSLQQLCAILDRFNAEDLEAGRPRSDLYAAKLLVEKTTFADRQDRGRRREK